MTFIRGWGIIAGLEYSAHNASQRFALRPLEIKQLFDFAIRLFRSNFSGMFTAMALVEAPLLLVAIVMTTKLLAISEAMQKSTVTGQTSPFDFFAQFADQGLFIGGLVILSLAYQLLVLPLGMLTCSRLGATALIGEPVSLAEAFEFAKSRYWPTQVSLAVFVAPELGLSLLVLIPVLLTRNSSNPDLSLWLSIFALTMIMLGGFATFLAYFRCFPALTGALQASEDPVGEGMFAQGLNYLKRAWSLSDGFGVRSFGMLLLYAFAQGIIQRGIVQSVQLIVLLVQLGVQHKDTAEDFFRTAAQGDATGTGISIAIASAISLLFPALQMCFMLLLYFDMRCRKEGFDLLLLLDEERLTA